MCFFEITTKGTFANNGAYVITVTIYYNVRYFTTAWFVGITHYGGSVVYYAYVVTLQ